MVKDLARNKINGSRSKVFLQILSHKKQRDNQSIESNRFKEGQYHQENGIGFRRDSKVSNSRSSHQWFRHLRSSRCRPMLLSLLITLFDKNAIPQPLAQQAKPTERPAERLRYPSSSVNSF
mmetsp:Transcript_7512/g.13537  ORF Transcript_7512/g.13537 Transcript_7512/m.13537 type:complete len:121 (-) Transcript_7512:466-828(-)